ncbi:MAG: hypothetical protein MUD01_09395 [Chloroflexaceae bacterium]|jgi:hypothetical protein|nr:hypothetical protein [Chloroflexaceae bacterium]
MEHPFAKQPGYGYALLGLLGCGAVFLLWIGLTGRFQPPTTAWDWFGAVLVVLLFPTFCLFLVGSTVKELRTTFDETGVQQRGLFKTTRIAWHDVKKLDDLAFSGVVLKTARQQLTIDLMCYRNPHQALIALRNAVPPKALVNELTQVQERWRDDRSRHVIGFWVTLGLSVLFLLLGLLFDRVLLMLLLVVPFWVLQDWYPWYQRRGVDSLKGMSYE